MAILLTTVLFCRILSLRLEIGLENNRSAIMTRRIKTKYPGVFYREAQRIGRNGTENVYYVLYKKDGKLIESKVGRQYADNMSPSKASRIRSDYIEGNSLPASQKRKEVRWTLSALWESFERHKKDELKSFRDDRYRYHKHVAPSLGDKLIEELCTLDIERLKRKIPKKLAPATVKQILSLIKRMIRFGAGLGYFKMPDLGKLSFKMPKVNNETTEDLTPAQLKKLFDVLEHHDDKQIANLMKLALFLGLRRGELFRLQWEHIDFDRGFVMLIDPKGGKNQKIPLNDAARDALIAHERTTSPYVFPGRNGKQRTDCKRAVATVKKKAGLPDDFRPLHGLRHVFASALASSGKVDMYTLQKLLTHKSASMTQRYAHLRDEAMQKASDVASDIFRNKVAK